ncbi:DUF2478 domain-containing protein [Candidatus Bipolaricaulota bacterium]|nr:DUF2478 domain-containing protein [Candidatus Bipolaricaulota bacterium]
MTEKDPAEAFFTAQKEGKRGLILTGPIGSGKTRSALALAQALSEKGIPLGGVLSPRVMVAGKTVGYLVRDLRSGKELLLCSQDPPGIRFRRYFFRPEALAFANEVLIKAAKEAEVVVVDEVGPLELSGGGFAPGLKACFASSAFLVLTVRPALVPEVLVQTGLLFEVFCLP